MSCQNSHELDNLCLGEDSLLETFDPNSYSNDSSSSVCVFSLEKSTNHASCRGISNSMESEKGAALPIQDAETEEPSSLNVSFLENSALQSQTSEFSVSLGRSEMDFCNKLLQKDPGDVLWMNHDAAQLEQQKENSDAHSNSHVAEASSRQEIEIKPRPMILEKLHFQKGRDEDYCASTKSNFDKFAKIETISVAVSTQLSTSYTSSEFCRPLLLKARNTTSSTCLTESPKDGIVISQCKKEWLEKLQLPKKDVLTGKVKAVGQIRDYEQGTARRMMVVEPSLNHLPAIRPLIRVSVADLSTTSTSISFQTKAPLGRPSFSPFEQGMLAIGGEAHPTRDSSPTIMIFSVQRSPVIRMKSIASAPLAYHASGICWLSSNELLVSAGPQLMVMKINDQALRIRSQLPQFHDDDIRDVQLNPFKTNWCLSGGYDGKVFITDLERVVSDQLGSMKISENFLYSAVDSVSSVAWNPVVGNIASVTCDSGYLHIFDPRISSNDRRTTIVETGGRDLYSHAWSDASSMLLGYGDGSLRLFDIRKLDECIISFQDPYVRRIGDVVFDPQRRYALTFGNPRFSVWRFDSQRFTLLHHDPDCISEVQLEEDCNFKVSGSFLLTGGRQHGMFGTTDSFGNFSLYDLHSADCPVMLVPGGEST